MVNGIPELTTRSDLLDRSICITLPTIHPAKRKTENELRTEFNSQLPQILGALLHAISSALVKLPDVKLDSPPRMADFATWSVAAEEGLELSSGTFLSAYTDNTKNANDLAIEVSSIGPSIIDLVEKKSHWEGTAQELLDELEDNYCSDQIRNRRDWPKKPQAIGKSLRHIAPNLRRLGIDIQFDRGKTIKRRRLICLKKMDILPSNMSNANIDKSTKIPELDMLDISESKTQAEVSKDLQDESSS